MQARKNQGLYYSEETPAGVITWDGNTQGRESVDLSEPGFELILYKVSDNFIPQSKITSLSNAEGVEFDFYVRSEELVSVQYIMGAINEPVPEAGLIYCFNNPQSGEQKPFDGLTGVYVTENVRTIEYDAYGVAIHHIEPKYIKDIYYEETSEGEQTYIRGDNYEGGKISDNTPTQSDIISLDGIPASELYFNTITHGYTIAISANPQRDQEVVTVYTEDSEGASKGIYFPEVVIFGGTWAEELHWYGTNTTVHQIPEKYLPITKTLDSESTDDQIPSAKTVYEAIPDVSGKENTSNKVTSLSSQSTDTQYPSAKCVYDIIGDIETLINAL